MNGLMPCCVCGRDGWVLFDVGDGVVAHPGVADYCYLPPRDILHVKIKRPPRYPSPYREERAA